MLEGFRQAKKDPIEKPEAATAEENAKEGLSRRRFMQLGGSAVLSAAFAVGVGENKAFAKLLETDANLEQHEYDEGIREAKKFLKETYGINLSVGTDNAHADITGDIATLESYRASLRFLRDELEQKYPPEMIKRMGSAHGGIPVKIASKLKLAETNKSGERVTRSIGGAVADGKTVFLNTDSDEEHQRKMIHHELNHRAIAEWDKEKTCDKQWKEFHAPLSLDPYRPLQKGIKQNDPPSERFFLTNYAGQNPLEDMATCAEWMMTPLLFAKFNERIRTEKDPVIKDILTKKFLETRKNYYVWSGGKIGTAFWERIGTEGYRRLREELEREELKKKSQERVAQLR